MSSLIILGAGGFGREILSWARSAGWAVKGFLDDNPETAKDVRLRVPVLTGIDNYVPVDGDAFVCGIGIPSVRQSSTEKIAARGGRFVSIIHPSAIIAEGAAVGEGVVICPFAIISVDARLDNGAVVYYHSSVDHDARVGRWTQISGHCDITGGAVIGSSVLLGSHATVLPGVHVGHRAIVGAGAVVTRNVQEGATVAGVPAVELSALKCKGSKNR